MANVDITVDTLVSALTPAGGSASDHYFISNSAILTVDQNFTFLQVSVGINSTSTKSAGTLACRAGFSLSANEPTLTSQETLSIEVYGLGKVTDGTPITNRDQPAIFKGIGTDFPRLNIRLRESGAVWDVGFYVLIKAEPSFEIYADLSSEPFPAIPISARVDVSMISEEEGGARFALQNRFAKRPRFFREGEESRSVLMEVSFDVEAAGEVGLWQQLKRLKELNVLGSLITKRRVWTRMRIVQVGPIEEVSGQSTFRGSPVLKFQEDAT